MGIFRKKSKQRQQPELNHQIITVPKEQNFDDLDYNINIHTIMDELQTAANERFETAKNKHDKITANDRININFNGYDVVFNGMKLSVKELQQLLVDFGYDIGKTGAKRDGVDGILGRKTEKALQDFIKDFGLSNSNVNRQAYLAQLPYQVKAGQILGRNEYNSLYDFFIDKNVTEDETIADQLYENANAPITQEQANLYNEYLRNYYYIPAQHRHAVEGPVDNYGISELIGYKDDRVPGVIHNNYYWPRHK